MLFEQFAILKLNIPQYAFNQNIGGPTSEIYGIYNNHMPNVHIK